MPLLLDAKLAAQVLSLIILIIALILALRKLSLQLPTLVVVPKRFLAATVLPSAAAKTISNSQN